MHGIAELKEEYAFLRKIQSGNKIFNDSQESSSKTKRTNFVLHPKRLISDSETSSESSSPRKFSSGTVIKHTVIDDESNKIYSEFQQSKRKTVSKLTKIHSCSDREIPYYEADIGDYTKTEDNFPKGVETVSNASVATTKKTYSKARPSSTRVDNFDKKFTNLVEKSLKIIHEIQALLEKGIPAPDGEEDYTRRLKRLQEFSSRFSRIYLYPLLRQMNELSATEKVGASAINQKVLYAHQLVLQGLQAYLTHLPTSIGKCCSDKLKALLEQALYLCQIHGLVKKNDFSENDEFINAMQTHTELLLQTVDTFELKFSEETLRPSQPSAVVKKKVNNKPQSRTKPRLSMYSVTASFRRDAEWKKAVDALANNKFNVKSRYKTATFKHRPPIEKPHIVELPNKVKLFPKRSSSFLKNTPRKSPMREDDIQTMVELQAPTNSTEVLNHNGNAPDFELVRDNDPKVEEDDGVKQALEVLRVRLVGEESQAMLGKIADVLIQDKKTDDDKIEEKKMEPIVTVTGAKNAKLICIKVDDSEVGNDDDHRIDKEIMTDAEIELVSSETQTDLNNKRNTCSKSRIKISRLPKINRPVLQLLPKHYAINIIQYKLQYGNFRKHNPMYKRTTNIQPWILMGRISDDILDHILESVTSEMEVNEILENLYNAEFQY